LSGNRLETLRRTLALDGFVLIKTLGQGRFGSCYLMSRDTKHYVLKIFNPNDVKRRKEKLARESKFLKKIDHPAIPKLNQLLDRDGFYGLVMEKMPGQSLEHLLEWDYIFNKKRNYSDHGAINCCDGLSVGAAYHSSGHQNR
jgi:serine/threonine-protein kinase